MKTKKFAIFFWINILLYTLCLNRGNASLYFKESWTNEDYAKAVNQPGARLINKAGAVAGTKFIGATYPPESKGIDRTIFVVDSELHQIVWGYYERVKIFGMEYWLGNAGRFGSYGSAPGAFKNPASIAVRSNGDIWVSDSSNCRIVKLKYNVSDNNVTLAGCFGHAGSGDGEIVFPGQLSVDKYGNVYVADTGNHRIQKFDANGNFIMKFGEYGHGNGQFINPSGVTVSLRDYIYVADTGNNRIQMFDLSGNFIRLVSKVEGIPENYKYHSLDSDINGNLYVADSQNNLIYKFTSQLEYLSSSVGNPLSPFKNLKGIAIDKSYDVWGKWYSIGGMGVVEEDRATLLLIGMGITDISITDADSGPGKINFTLTDDGIYSIRIYDSQNNLVRTLVSEARADAGKKSISWDGNNDAGSALPLGTYTVQVTATDAYGHETITKYLFIKILSHFIVSITTPQDNSSVDGITKISAQVTSETPITKVEFYTDDVLKYTSLAVPYSWNWDTTGYAVGSVHRIKTVAYDITGRNVSSEIKVVVRGVGFNYRINAAGTQPLGFNWTVTATGIETWTEYGGDNSVTIWHNACQQYCTDYLYPSDPSYSIYSWDYSLWSSLFGGRDDGTYIDYANNRLVIKTYTGGYREHWEITVFGVVIAQGDIEIAGWYWARYNVYGRRTRQQTVTASVSGSGTVDKREGNKLVTTFSLYPQPQHGGTVSNVSYSISDDNSRVDAWLVASQVYARTSYSDPWSATESGWACVNIQEGDKLIATSSLVAPNRDTTWAVAIDNPKVKTWMVSNKLYAKLIDNTPPITKFEIVGTKYESEGKIYIRPDTEILLSAEDPVIHDVASGVRSIFYCVDDSSFTTYEKPVTLAEGIHTIKYYAIDNVGNAEQIHTFVFHVDNTPPVSSIAAEKPVYQADGKTYISEETALLITAADPVAKEVASGVLYSKYRIDEQIWERYGNPLSLKEGIRKIEFRSVDNVGNIEQTKTKTYYVDETPPVSVLQLDEPSCSAHNEPGEKLHPYPVVTSKTPINVIPTDPIVEEVASGVKLSRWQIKDFGWQDYSIPFNTTGPDGEYLISYYSVDNVENTELIKSTTITLDNTPPVAKILLPSKENVGLCKIVNGTTTIVGSVSDLHLKWYKLEYQVVGSTNWFTIQDKTYFEIKEGVLAIWDTTNLSEDWYDIRLTAEDCVKNQATDKVQVYVGKPELTLSFGKVGKEPDEFNSPSYIVRDSSGNIWVSDTNNDRIEKFSSSGTFIFHLGSSEIRFNKPTGLTIDSQGNLYVADRNNDRVLKLNKENKLLSEIKGFNKPHGLAVDSEDNLFVADRNNDCVQKFDKDGKLILTINTGIGFDNLNKPQGVIGLDTSGKIYVTDRNNDRILIFNSTGGFISVIGSSGTSQGQFNKPDGIWVNSLGYIYVADSNNDRIQKSDKYGNFVMSFGRSNQFNKPAGITLDEQGNLYVVDSNNAQVKIFGLPSSVAVLAALPSSSPSPLADFKLGEFYSFPNPAKYGKNPTIHFECGIADEVEIHIYDIAGDLTHTHEIPGSSWQIVDGKYCYEYTWNISDIASGVYIYCIQGKKSGCSDIKVRKKLAVIK